MQKNTLQLFISILDLYKQYYIPHILLNSWFSVGTILMT